MSKTRTTVKSLCIGDPDVPILYRDWYNNMMCGYADALEDTYLKRANEAAKRVAAGNPTEDDLNDPVACAYYDGHRTGVMETIGRTLKGDINQKVFG